MNVSEAVDRWVVSSLPEVAAQGFAQIDLDDLLAGEPQPGAMVGVECLQRAVLALPAELDLDVLLTLPLDFSDRVDGALPDLDDLLDRDWRYGRGRSVPGLYLIHPLQRRGVEEVEEYRVPLKSRHLSSTFAAYFRTWRDLRYPEFNRCVYI